MARGLVFDPVSPGSRRGLLVSVTRTPIRTPNWKTRTSKRTTRLPSNRARRSEKWTKAMEDFVHG